MPRFGSGAEPDGSGARARGYTTDLSHPAFYLPGQGFNFQSHRAFAALDACKPVAAPCTTGIECCPGTTCIVPNGAPANAFGAPVGACSVPPPERTCAQVDQRCAVTADCCDPANYCINGFCALVALD